jgi:hypothetical protein
MTHICIYDDRKKLKLFGPVGLEDIMSSSHTSVMANSVAHKMKGKLHKCKNIFKDIRLRLFICNLISIKNFISNILNVIDKGLMRIFFILKLPRVFFLCKCI